MTDLAFAPLTPSRWDNFVTLFSEHGVQNGCWCTYWRLTRRQFHKEYYGEKSKQLMHTIVLEGSIPGLLAYEGDQPIGWISVAPRQDFPSLDRSTILRSVDNQLVWSIVCFFIASAYRQQGLSTQLVAAAIEHARARGAEIIEAYPHCTSSSHSLPAERYMGTLSTFHKAGFHLAADRGGKRVILRLNLHAP